MSEKIAILLEHVSIVVANLVMAWVAWTAGRKRGRKDDR